MIGLLILLVVIYSLNIYWISNRFWFGYILILVILSGVLVIFSYVLSLCPNERFEFFSLVFLISIFIWYFFVEEKFNVIRDFSFLSNFLWEGVNRIFNIYLVFFLLGVIIIVVYVSCPKIGALRCTYLSAWLKG